MGNTTFGQWCITDHVGELLIGIGRRVVATELTKNGRGSGCLSVQYGTLRGKRIDLNNKFVSFARWETIIRKRILGGVDTMDIHPHRI